MDDVRAVLDAVDSERAGLLGISDGGAMSTLFAAMHPERTAALILMGTFPREMHAPDYPWGVSEENLQQRLGLLEEEDRASTATRDWLGRVAPNIPRDLRPCGGTGPTFSAAQAQTRPKHCDS
jgi:pimeloyl-ACP methyl ester carboxylesterase